MMKVGAFIGDMAKVSIGTLIFAGKHIGVAAQVMGTVGVDVPSFAFFDGSSGGPRKERIELRLERVMKVQERMMARRGKVVSEGRRDLASRIFDTTKGERKAFGAKKGELGER